MNKEQRQGPFVSTEIASTISEQFENQVAFFNLKDKNAFFFVSPEEARVAMDYIKKWRVDGFSNEKRERIQDQYVNDLKRDYNKMDIGTVVFYYREGKTDFLDFLNSSFCEIEKNDRTVDALVMNALTYHRIREYGRMVYDEACRRGVYSRGVFGSIYSAEIYVWTVIAKDHVILISTPDKKEIDFLTIRTIYWTEFDENIPKKDLT